MSFPLRCVVAVMVVCSMFAFALPGTTAQGAEEAAVFPVCYRGGTGLPGAPMLTLQLVVSAENEMVSGVGVLTQAVSPPLNLHVNVHGHFVQEGKEVIVTAVGAKPGGAVQAVLILPSGWGQPGKADFKWYANNHFGDSGGTVPAAPCR